MTLPSRSLFGPKPLRYVSAFHTDIRRTFRRARLLARLRERQSTPGTPSAAPSIKG